MTRAATYLGFALLGLLWLVPLERLTGAAFPVHMLRHMGLVAVVAPLLAFGLGDRLRWLMISPLIATVLEFMVVWAWHLPHLHGMAYLLPAGFALEQGSFLIVGLLVWVSALRAHNGLAGAGSLLLTSMHMTLLGALLILAPRDVFAEICGRAADLGGQQLGGLLMLGIGAAGAVGHLLRIRAFDYAEAALLAPLRYLEIIMQVLLGFWLFGDFPDLLAWVGIGLIVGVGVYLSRNQTAAASGHTR